MVPTHTHARTLEYMRTETISSHGFWSEPPLGKLQSGRQWEPTIQSVVLSPGTVWEAALWKATIPPCGFWSQQSILQTMRGFPVWLQHRAVHV